MSDEFERDLKKAQNDAAAARSELLDVLRELKDSDLDRERRGGWTIQKVLEHTIHSEVLYARVARHLCGKEQPEEPIPDVPPKTVEEAIEELESSRKALLESIEGVDEERFYKLHVVGHEEYSVLSLLENVTLHDREHGPQIREIVEATT